MSALFDLLTRSKDERLMHNVLLLLDRAAWQLATVRQRAEAEFSPGLAARIDQAGTGLDDLFEAAHQELAHRVDGWG